MMEFKLTPYVGYPAKPTKKNLCFIQEDRDGNKVSAGYIHINKEEAKRLIEVLQKGLETFPDE